MSLTRVFIVVLAALVVVSVRSFTLPQLPKAGVISLNDNNTKKNKKVGTQCSSSSSLNIYGSYGYGRGWDYDYGNLNYGTDTYRQRYNDGYSGGVNLSYNGYSQQTNVARGRGRIAPYSYSGYGNNGGYYDDWDGYGYGSDGGYGGYGRFGGSGYGNGYGRGGYNGYGGYGRGYNDDSYGRGTCVTPLF
jgi:hypothetical protein